jgi:hypothetical protein
LVVTVKSAKEPNTRIKSDLDMAHPARAQSDQQGMLDVRFDTTGIQRLRQGFDNL